jgi:translation initiation factor 4G
LFRAESLQVKIILHCIEKLLGSLEEPDEVEIEALCKLITATGEMVDDIDRTEVKEAMDSYFDRMQKLSTNQSMSWRVSFMLRDLTDPRKNKWKQRCEMTSFRFQQMSVVLSCEVYI